MTDAGTTAREDLVERLLVGGRIVVGGGTLVSPQVLGRAFGISTAANPALPYVGRLFGVRAVFMALLLATSDGNERDRQLRAGVVVDVIDALAAFAAGRAGHLDRRTATAAFAAAATEASFGAWLLSAGRARSPR